MASFLAIFYSVLAASTTWLIGGSGLQMAVEFALLSCFSLLFAFDAAQMLFALLSRPKPVERLTSLAIYPPVALLYTVCDDLVDQCLQDLQAQAYPNLKVFVLDDSADPLSMTRIDHLVNDCDYVLVRRGLRTGFKAGNLNHWLSRWGEQFPYFVIADADSRLPATFVEDMVKFGEHPANRRVAMWQADIAYWNVDSPLTRAMGSLSPVGMWVLHRIGNRLAMVLSWGHNNLCRTAAVSAVGGFDERFVSEDSVTAWRLISGGWDCVLVDVESYEAAPASFATHTRRTVKWARSSIQALRSNPGPLPITVLLQSVLGALQYIAWPFIVLSSLVLICSGSSSMRDASGLVAYTLNPKSWSDSHVMPYAFLAVLDVYFVFGKLPVALRCGVGPRRYFSALFINQCRSFFMVWPLGRALVWSGDHSFTVTDKADLTGAAVRHSPRSDVVACALISAIALCAVWRNPAVVVFGWVWLVPLVATPAVVIWADGFEWRGLSLGESPMIYPAPLIDPVATSHVE